MLSPKGVWRVVWDRERINTATGQKTTDHIPFLSVSRSLGDFWSYNPRTGQYVVSPSPDVFVHPMDLSVQSFVVVASDGLWNVMTPTDVVRFIHDYEQKQSDNQAKDVVSALIKEALARWERKNLQADNVSVLVAFLSEEESGSQRQSASPCKPTTADLPHSSAGATSSSGASHSSQAADPMELSRLQDTDPAFPSQPSPPSSEAPSSSTITPPLSATPPPAPLLTSPSSSSSSPSSSTSSSPSRPSTVKKVTQTRSGSSEYYSEVWPDGVTIQYETRIKLRHRRKHRRQRSMEKQLLRYDIIVLWVQCLVYK